MTSRNHDDRTRVLPTLHAQPVTRRRKGMWERTDDDVDEPATADSHRGGGGTVALPALLETAAPSAAPPRRRAPAPKLTAAPSAGGETEPDGGSLSSLLAGLDSSPWERARDEFHGAETAIIRPDQVRRVAQELHEAATVAVPALTRGRRDDD